MKTRLVVLAVALWSITAIAVTHAHAANLIVGTWHLNVAKSTFDGVPVLKSQTRTYEDWGSGVVHAKFEGIDTEGKRTFTEFAARYDDRDYPRVVRGSQTAGTIALRKISDRTSEFTYKEDGKVTITGTRTISPDGRVSTVKYTGTNTDGKRVSATLVFDRQ
jgi:hypothetical protein